MVAAMEIQKGFKQTEVGIIPIDWNLVSIEAMSIPNGLVRGPFGGALKKEFFVPKGYKVYEQRNAIYCDVSIGRYYINYSKFDELRRFEIKKGDFIVSCSGTIGRIYQIPGKFEKGVINQALLKITINDNQFSDKYFNQYFKWGKFQQRIIDNTQGGAMKNLIGMMEFKKTLIPLPPTKAEQIAIATALNDADELITQLEKLIAKKRAIKQGAMQELLKPKDGWEVKKLGEVLKVRHGKSQKEVAAYNGVYPILASGGVIGRAKVFLYDKPSVLIGRKGTIDEPQYKDTPFWSVDTLFYTEIYQGYDAKFIFYMFNLIDWYSYNEASGVPSLNAKTIELIEKQFPKFEEQTHIAQILSDMDAEIEALKKKLNKHKMIKQGMMQNLLTGRIRLV